MFAIPQNEVIAILTYKMSADFAEHIKGSLAQICSDYTFMQDVGKGI